MSHLPPSVAEATNARASTASTYFLSRIVIALLLTGIDIFVFLKSATQGLRNSIGRPLLHWLIAGAVIGLAFSLAHVWCKTFRYRQPRKPNSTNPFL